MARARDSVFRRYRLLYSIVYILLISYPLYRILDSSIYLYGLFRIIIYLSIILIGLGIYLSIPEIIILSYIVCGTVYQIIGIPGTPSLYEVLIYTLLILHGDIITRLLTMGVGYRRIRARIPGIAVSIILISITIFIYITISYGLAQIFIELTNIASTGNLVAEMVIGYFLQTRVGELLLFILISLSVYYVLHNYINGLLSDTILLSHKYVASKLKTYFNELYRRSHEGGLWHQKLFVRMFYIVTLFFTWSLLSPIISMAMSILLRYSPKTLHYGLSFLLTIAISILVYALIYNRISGLVKIQFKPMLKNPFEKLYRVSYAGVAISISVLIAYIVLLFILYPYKVVHALATVFGLEPPAYDYELNTYVDRFDTWYLLFSQQLPYLMDKYIDSVEMEFNWFVKMVKTLIDILWG